MPDESKTPEAEANMATAARVAHAVQAEVNAHAAVAAVQAEVDAPSWYLVGTLTFKVRS